MVQVYRLQKAHPDAGEFRIWSLLAQPDISVRTVGRIMAFNKRVYDNIPHVPKPGRPQPPQPHPYKAQHRHEYWFIDGRQMDFTLDGVKWWSIIILEDTPAPFSRARWPPRKPRGQRCWSFTPPASGMGPQSISCRTVVEPIPPTPLKRSAGGSNPACDDREHAGGKLSELDGNAC